LIFFSFIQLIDDFVSHTILTKGEKQNLPEC